MLVFFTYRLLGSCHDEPLLWIVIGAYVLIFVVTFLKFISYHNGTNMLTDQEKEKLNAEGMCESLVRCFEKCIRRKLIGDDYDDDFERQAN